MRCTTRTGFLFLLFVLTPWLTPAAGCGKGDPVSDSTPAPANDTVSVIAAGASPASAPAAALSASLTAALEKTPAEDRARSLPEGTDAVAGKPAYEAQCVSCHGAAAKGDGVAAAFLDPGPGDLSSASRVAKTTAGEKAWLITNGVGGGSAMPGFSATLDQEQIWQVVAYLDSLQP
jgi:mono/diheme cytochrome c family protein